VLQGWICVGDDWKLVVLIGVKSDGMQKRKIPVSRVLIEEHEK
jgi:hypothetical protein